MPGFWSGHADPMVMRKVRARLTTMLKAKGLTEGTGKFDTVMTRHLRKRSTYHMYVSMGGGA